MKLPVRLLRRLRRGARDIPVLATLFLAAVATFLQPLLYDQLVAIAGPAGVLVLFAAGVAVIVTAMLAYSLHQDRRHAAAATRIADKPQPPQYRGLIVLVSNPATATKAIAYHQPVLETCWLVTTPQRRDIAATLAERWGEAVHILRKPLADSYDTRMCYECVRDVYQREAATVGLAPEDVISDITGGTKPMTMGMILACIEGEYSVEHVPTEYDPDTLAPRGPLPPIEIEYDLPPLDNALEASAADHTSPAPPT